jgi:hypothetical protein
MLNEVKHLDVIHRFTVRCFAALNMTMICGVGSTAVS